MSHGQIVLSVTQKSHGQNRGNIHGRNINQEEQRYQRKPESCRSPDDKRSTGSSKLIKHGYKEQGSMQRKEIPGKAKESTKVETNTV